MAKRPEDRYASAGDLARACGRALGAGAAEEEPGVAADRPAPAGESGPGAPIAPTVISE
jgi:hypothetical protein